MQIFPKNMEWQRYTLPLVRRLLTRSSSFLCYVLLLSMVQWDQFKIFWREKLVVNTGKMALPTVRNREHLFIYNSFIFDRGPPSNATFVVGKVQLIVLFLAKKEHKTTEGMFCMVDKNLISIKKMQFRQEQITSLSICALELFVVTCTLDGLNAQDGLFNEGGEGRNRYSLMLRDANPDGHKRSTKVALNPNQPDYKKRGLVLCMSRVFLYERWQMFLTAIEAYRQFKVDLVVAHVQSALMGVFELMKAYERSGILSIRPGIQFPHHVSMEWNPNAETEFNGQILLAHECFYEFREGAAFIGLIDWDDLLVPSRHFDSLPAAFAAAAKQYPQAAYFKVNKLEASFVQQATAQARFSLKKLAEDGIRVADMYNDEKMVVRPRELRGFWMHSSDFLEPYRVPIQLFTNYSILLHLANEERVDVSEFRTPFLTRFDIDKMHSHANSMLEEIEHRKAHLPRAHPFYDALVACHSRIFAYYKSTGQGDSRCLSYSLCTLPPVRVQCMVTRSGHRHVRTQGARSILHVRHESRFERADCVQSAGI